MCHRLILAIVWLVSFTLTVLLVVGTADYAIEKYDQADPRCINSLCEYPCKEGARFVRHQGCVK